MIWVFVLCALLIVYVLVGWPILLHLLTLRHRPSELVGDGMVTPTVSVIIAVHNGAEFLGLKLASIARLDYPADRVEILVVSDGSTDDTEAIASRHPGAILIRVPRGGKCRALNAAIPRASGDLLLLTDVRQELDPSALRLIVARFDDPQVGAVSGELLIRRGDSPGAADVGLYWRFETWIRDRLSALDSMFGATGPIYALRRELAVPIPEDILLDDMYLPLAAYFMGYRLVMARGAVAWDYPMSSDREFIRKVRTLAGNYQIVRHYPALLDPRRNRLWIHFVSYKIGRLALPWFLLGAFFSAFWLPAPWNGWVPTLAICFVLLAIVDRVVPQAWPLRKLSSPMATFGVMMVAAMLALRVFFVDPRSLWIVTSVAKTKTPG